MAVQAVTGGVLLRIKVVPGASRTRLAGMLGARLKIHAAAPPEAGKANKAVCKLLAELLGVSTREVAVVAGKTHPQKTIEVAGVTTCDAVQRLAKAMLKNG